MKAISQEIRPAPDASAGLPDPYRRRRKARIPTNSIPFPAARRTRKSSESFVHQDIRLSPGQLARSESRWQRRGFDRAGSNRWFGELRPRLTLAEQSPAGRHRLLHVPGRDHKYVVLPHGRFLVVSSAAAARMQADHHPNYPMRQAGLLRSSDGSIKRRVLQTMSPLRSCLREVVTLADAGVPGPQHVRPMRVRGSDRLPFGGAAGWDVPRCGNLRRSARLLQKTGTGFFRNRAGRITLPPPQPAQSQPMHSPPI